MRLKYFLCFFASLFLCFALFSGQVKADEVDNAGSQIMSGQLEAGAQELVRFVKAHPRDRKKTPKALLLLGQTLDRLQDLFSERAEMTCYWGKKGSLSCMQAEAGKLNSIYGAGTFKAVTDIAYIPYTGEHYNEIIRRFSSSKEAPEAEFQLLLKNLIGHPDQVLPRVKSFMKKHKRGDVHRKALLLWARVNEDLWYIHRDWSWVLYNERVSPEELMIRAEPYRQDALKTYRKLARKYGNTFEGKQAKRELSLLEAQQYDNTTYSILADSVGGTPDKWGNPIPAPKLKATQRGLGDPSWKRKSQSPGVTAPSTAPSPSKKTKDKSSSPSRWE